jgi:serine/threonine protein phosphatase PrpC
MFAAYAGITTVLDGTGWRAPRVVEARHPDALRDCDQENTNVETRAACIVAREIMARVERFYRHVDAAVTSQRRMGPIRTDQTTLTATFGAGHDLFFAHVGHSRAYLFRNGHLLRLTRDHTIGRHQSTTVATAPLVDVNASARDLAHILTNTIGMRGSVGPTIDIERFRLCDDDRVLVCTNGLTDMVSENLIAEILATENAPDDQCRSLVDLATSLGGVDDVTALVARYRLP